MYSSTNLIKPLRQCFHCFWYLSVKLTQPWTPEIFLECYCVARRKPVRHKKGKAQAAAEVCCFGACLHVLIFSVIRFSWFLPRGGGGGDLWNFWGGGAPGGGRYQSCKFYIKNINCPCFSKQSNKHSQIENSVTPLHRIKRLEIFLWMNTILEFSRFQSII